MATIKGRAQIFNVGSQDMLFRQLDNLSSVDRMIAVGERATYQALESLAKSQAA